ncbi:hypothetical protein TNCV_2581921 [Trichonephila clavipes]|nr:hypothetical protein TNCV_2581921 [Trichonephila clavipes]
MSVFDHPSGIVVRTVIGMVLKALAEDRLHLPRSHDEFREPRAGLCRSCDGRGSRVVKVPDRGWPCHEFKHSTTKDPPCRVSMHFKSVESLNVLPLVYADNPQTLYHLEDNIRRVIADIRPQMLEKVIENGTSRLDYIRASRGSPMPEIIFKM